MLLVSTDPASNLSEVLGTEVGDHQTQVVGVNNLVAMNIDPEAEAAAYRERTIGPMRGVLPDEALKHMEEQLSGACTMEIASFDQFTALLTDSSQMQEFDHVIFDTAPTGHTLRLLQLPAAWSDFLETNSSGASCLGPLSGLDAQRKQYAEAVEILSDASRTTLVLVARAESSALREAERTRDELEHQGIHNQRLVINGRFRATDRSDTLACALEERGERAVQDMPHGLKAVPVEEVPLLGHNLVGIDALRALAGSNYEQPPVEPAEPWTPDLPSIESIVNDVAASGHGLVMVMGKGWRRQDHHRSLRRSGPRRTRSTGAPQHH